MRVALLCLVITAAASAQSASAQNWAEFRPQGVGYALEMPGEWTITEETENTKVGPLQVHIATVDLGSHVYMTMYAEYPKAAIAGQPVTPILDGARDGAVSQSHGSLRTEQRILVSNYPGREIIVDGPQGVVLIDKFFLLDNKLVQAMLAGPRGLETEPGSKKFLDSLQVVGTPH